ncbi:MAG: TolC family protein [Phycisphaerae bacterium]|nr:TolC family protein [Phycisphaerae bacterium]
MVGKTYVNLLILLAAGCAAQSTSDHSSISDVSEGLRERTDYELGQPAEAGRLNLPEGVSLDDGLSQDEAVALALWNNARFQADLATLGFARADLVEARMLSNPVFSLLFPVGPKLLETNLSFAIDVLWQRPHRIAAAKLDSQGLSENLVEHGLALIRDVRIAYADLRSAREHARLAREDAELRVQMAELAQVRLRAGHISDLEASFAQIDSLRADDAAKRSSQQATVARQELCALLGLIAENTTFHIAASDTASGSTEPIDAILKRALAARPDLRAAELAIEAAGERLGWEKSKVYNLIAIIDGDDKGKDSLTVGPGLAVEVPVFNRNDGKTARAKARLEQAVREYEAVRQGIILQVRQAHTQYISAHDEFESWDADIVPSWQTAVERTEKALAAGQVTYLSVLQARMGLVAACVRRAESAGRLHRAAAQLNYSVGRKII